ncbi:MAG: hypothetical protein H8Z69_02885 [Nanohaloarchaea archaeon]|nr:hypothetical protein [Candidatus Nanohaloarchaea archaeon]
MDSKITIFLALVVVASGCAQQESENSPEKGLEVKDFSISEKSLVPSQQAYITLVLKNHHTQQINLRDISLYNTGLLKADKQGCRPENIEVATADVAPEMECTWKVEAPEDIGAFNSKSVSLKLNIEYDSQLEPTEPFKIDFKSPEDITETSNLEKTYTNSEIKLDISTENPAPSQGRLIDLTISSAGKGRVASDFSMDYSPSGVFEDCDQQKEIVVGSSVEFSCQISSDQTVERNLMISTSYKYVKAPTLDVEVVKR